MPRKNFENIGVLQGYEYIRGVITDNPDIDTDTCMVSIKNAEGNAVEYADTPIFYHCSEDAVEREDNGAIEGAASGFVKDDEVIVLKQRKGAPGHDGEPVSEPKIFVIGHVNGIKSCCFVEPWDGPLFTTKNLWIDEYLYYHRIDADGIPDFPNTSAFNVSVEDGALVIHRDADQEPTGGWESIISQSYGEDDYHEFALSFPSNPITTGQWDGIPIIKPNSTKMRVSLGEVLFTCCRWPSVIPKCYFFVGIFGVKTGTTEKCIFSVYFISEAPIGNYIAFSGNEVINQGHYCLASVVMEHNYQLEFEIGGDVGVKEATDGISRYYAYLPMDEPMWINFPFPIDVKTVGVYMQLTQRGLYANWMPRQEMPGITVKIDKIEVC